MNKTQLVPGHQFAAMALPAIGGAVLALPPKWVRSTTDGVSIVRGLELPVSPSLRNEIGRRAAGSIENADLYVVAVGPPTTDIENLRLLVHWCYFCTVVSCGFMWHADANLVDGVVTDVGPNIKNYAVYEATSRPHGAPAGRLDGATLTRALERYSAVKAIEKAGHLRFGRVLYAFLRAMVITELDERLHQSVRVVEGFVHPGKNGLRKRFTERSQLFLTRSADHKLLLEHLWDLRSVVEHLHGPFAAINAPGERDRRLTFLLRSIQAESLARYCIEQFLDRPQLWPHFANDGAAEHFWALPQRRQRELWGERHRLDWLDHHFDPTQISDAALLMA